MQKCLKVSMLMLACAVFAINPPASPMERQIEQASSEANAAGSSENSGANDGLRIGDIHLPPGSESFWMDYYGTTAPTQAQIDDVAAAYDEILIRENPSNEDIVAFIRAVREVTIREQKLLGRFPPIIGADKAIARIPISHISTLFRASDIVDVMTLTRALKQMDVSQHKELILSELRTMPSLIEIAVKNGWATDAMQLVLKWSTEHDPKWHARAALNAMVENWSLDMREYFVHMLFNDIHSGEIVDYLRRLVHLDRESRQSIVCEAWLRHDPNDLSEGDNLQLARMAMNEGEVGALLTVLALLRGRAVSEETRKFAAPSHVLPLQLQLNACSLLGISLPAAELYNWVYERRDRLLFELATRQYILKDEINN